jgi:methylmalonyl-CoA/ethylmalonyl-CoA epimerase
MHPASRFGLSTIGQIGFASGDVPRLTAFYRDKLGIPLLFETANMSFFDCDGVRLMIGPPEGIERAGNSILYYKVEDIQSATGALKSRGVAFQREPHLVAKMPDHDLWMAFLRDPDENIIGLMSEVKRSST